MTEITDMQKKLTEAWRAVAFLFGIVLGAVAAMILVLVASIFSPVTLPTAFALQFLLGGVSGALMIWRLT